MVSPGELPRDNPSVCMVRGHQSGRDAADGRAGVLRLLHLTGGPADFRRRGARGVSWAAVQLLEQPVLTRIAVSEGEPFEGLSVLLGRSAAGQRILQYV